MEADILVSLALPHGLSWWWTSLWETYSLNQWEPGEWEKTSLHLSEEKGGGLGRRRSHQRNRKVPASKKITHSVLTARERTTQWQFLLRWQWKAKKNRIGFVSIGKLSGSPCMAEEHKRTSLGHGCSQHYTDVSAKGVKKRAESWFVINTVSTNTLIINSYYWYVVMQSFPW